VTNKKQVLGAKTLAATLTRLINSSITSGVFPEAWKKAIISPILKKVTQQKRKLQACQLSLSSIKGVRKNCQ